MSSPNGPSYSSDPFSRKVILRNHCHLKRKPEDDEAKTGRECKKYFRGGGGGGGGIVAKLYSTLCDFMDCSLSGSSVHGILQVRILE